MKVTEINKKELDEIIKQDKVVLDCYAPWCGPCRMISPIIDELAQELDQIKFYKTNIDNNSDIAMQYNIMSIPTILIFDKGTLKEQIVGLRSKKELKNLILK